MADTTGLEIGGPGAGEDGTYIGEAGSVADEDDSVSGSRQGRLERIETGVVDFLFAPGVITRCSIRQRHNSMHHSGIPPPSNPYSSIYA